MVRRSGLPTRTRLSLTPLEDRTVPAGNVFAQMSGSTLVITGDEFDNDMGVIGHSSGDVDIAGYNDTSINGVINGGLRFPGVERVVVFTGDGDDTISSTWSLLDATIGTGNGADRVHIRSWHMAGMTGDLEISSGDGRDDIHVVTKFHTGSVRVDAGNGHDLVWVGVEWIDGDLAIDAGNGNDHVGLYVSDFISRIGYVTGNLSIDGGNGMGDTLEGLNSFRWIIVVEGEVSISGFEDIL